MKLVREEKIRRLGTWKQSSSSCLEEPGARFSMFLFLCSSPVKLNPQSLWSIPLLHFPQWHCTMERSNKDCESQEGYNMSKFVILTGGRKRSRLDLESPECSK